MIELMEKTILTAMGLISISQKKAEELAEEMKQRLNIPEEQGRAFLTKLQDAAKENQIIISESCYQHVKESFQCKKLESIHLKNKAEPVIVYEVLE